MLKNIFKMIKNFHTRNELRENLLLASCSIGSVTGFFISVPKVYDLTIKEGLKNPITVSNFAIITSYTFVGFLTGVFYPITFPSIGAYSMYKLKNN